MIVRLLFNRRSLLTLIGSSTLIFFPTISYSRTLLETKKDQKKYGKAVSQGEKLIFPRDYGAHYPYGTEWWYITGWLSNGEGEEFAYQLTFFRRKTFIGENNPSRFAPKHLIFAHSTIISKKFGGLQLSQRAGRLGSGLVKCSTSDTNIQFEDWSFRREKSSDSYKINVDSKEFSLNLKLQPPNRSKTPVLRGENGFSRKGPEVKQASWYYSRPNLTTTGSVVINQETFKVQGASWLDHEWSSELLHPDSVGWDWVGINLLDGGNLMAFKLRKSDGSTLWSNFSMLDAQGKKHSLLTQNNPVNLKSKSSKIPPAEWTTLKEWRSPNSLAKYPISQTITIEKNIFKFSPLIKNQEVDARITTGSFYWEGAVTLSINEKFFGKGFLELTGYSSPLTLG